MKEITYEIKREILKSMAAGYDDAKIAEHYSRFDITVADAANIRNENQKDIADLAQFMDDSNVGWFK